MYELARALIAVGRDLREQGHKSYVASYRANKELVIPRMFFRELRQ